MYSNENYEPKKVSLLYRKIYRQKGSFFVDNKVERKPSYHKSHRHNTKGELR